MSLCEKESMLEKKILCGKLSLSIRRATFGELMLALDWAKREGWNPCAVEAEAKALYALDPKGFFGVFLEDSMVAFMTAVTYVANPRFAHIGIFIVKNGCRSIGVGKLLMDHVKRYLESSGVRTIYLNAVTNQVTWYRTFGFEVVCDNLTYVSTDRKILPSRGRKEVGILESSKDLLFESMCVFDSLYWGADRSKFLGKLLDQRNAFACVQKDKNSKIVGYGMIRPRQKGYRVGPLYSKNSSGFEKILRALVGKISMDESIYIDVSKNNESRADFLLSDEFGFKREDSVFTVFMAYSGDSGASTQTSTKCMAIESLEVGGPAIYRKQ